MAEVKNAFIKSKMNKDLDDRLIPNGEYRDAQNVQISKSQGPDVGALESVYGNELIKNFASALKTPAATVDPNIKCIGNFVDDFNNIIYSFWTDNTGEILNGANGTPNIPNGYLPEGAIGSLAIVAPGTGYTVGDEIPVGGDFNASGYNANVTVASVNGSGGVTGVDINFPGQMFQTGLGNNSTGLANGLILKLTGCLGNNFITSYSPQSGALRVIATGNFLNFSQKNPIIGVNLLENLLFFTDNRNQPRKVNVTRGGNTPAAATYYTREDQISVAKYNPYEPIRLYQLSALAAATATATGAASNTININVTPISGNIKVGQLVTGSGVLPNTFVSGFSSPVVTFNKQQNFSSTTLTFTSYETAMKDVVSPNIPLATSTTTNPYLITNYTGDVDFLEDKFAKFSYRFRFDDGEYSIFAPFTQTTFIPKQDGYFINNDEQSTIESTVVQFMENKINYIQLNLPLPSSGATLVDAFKITEVDILYKESDSLAVQVIETLPVSRVAAGAGGTKIFTYNYLGTKPFRTLPEDELIRVFDKIPVKAFSQELASNRVIYGNFQNKHTPPSGINYQVATNEKFEIQSLNSNKGVVAYPNSSLKENRNYQVGFVLSDRFGRQSSVLLSTNDSDTLTANGFGASTVFNPYQSATPASSGSSINWRGDSLKIEVLSEITSGINGKDATSSADVRVANPETGEPGLYNNFIGDYDYNPLGWYSYKIVVQQKEQEYYNVYLPGIVKGPLNTTTPSAFQELTGQTTLFNDNINKVPRDLSEVGPDQRQFRSSVRLFGRVQNTISPVGPYSPVGNQQYDPNISGTDLVPQSITVNVISDLKDLFDVDGVIPASGGGSEVNIFYDASSNPLIGRMISTKAGGIGTAQGTSTPSLEMNQLAILETEPVESRLDLFFETSTAGLISVLNPQINDNQGASNFNAWNYLQTEAMASASTVVNASESTPYTGYFYPQTALGNQILAYTISNFKVLKSGGSDISTRFNLAKTTITVGSTATATGAGVGTATINLSSISGTVKVDDLVTGTGVVANTFVLSIAGSTVVLNKVQTFSSTTLTFAPARDVLRLTTNDVFYYAPGSSATENYTFSFDVTDINGITNTIVKTGNLTNIAPTITNCTTPVTVGAGDTTVKTFAAVNGAIAATGQQASDLVWSIQSQQQNGLDVTVFSINSSGLLTVSNGIGAYDVTVRVIDAGGTAGFLTADCTFVVNVGVPPVDSNFNQGIALEAFDGDYNLLAFVDSDTNVIASPTLTSYTLAAPKIYSFTGIVGGSGYTGTTDLATTVLPPGGTGLKVNQVLAGGAIQSLSVEEAGSGYSLNDIITVVEGTNTTGGATINGIPFSGSDPTIATSFVCTSPNKYDQTANIYLRNNLKGALTQGQFYVSMSVFNADVSSTVALVNAPVVQYRANSSATWIDATDVNGEASNLNGQWLGIKGGMTSNTGPGGGNNFEVTNSGSSNQSGTKIQVFGVGGSSNGAGEYRIIQPNLNGTNLQFPSCSGSVSSFTTMTTTVGDANYPQIGTGPLYYEYRISTVGANCFSNMATTVYARERITKYVTQLYSNTSLTQVKTLTSGTYRFQRPSVNLEQNKDGAYIATFNASGLRTSLSSPCVYT